MKRRWERFLVSVLLITLLIATGSPVAARALEAGEELLKNGDFSGPDLFGLYTESGGAASVNIVDGELEIDVKSIGRVEHAIQPYYDGFGLEQGVEYELSWDVRSTVDRDLYVRIQVNGRDYHPYVMELVHATGEMVHHSVRFTMEEETDPAPRLCVNMGYVDTMQQAGADPEALSGHKVYFDNFSLKVIDMKNARNEDQEKTGARIQVNQLGFENQASKQAVFADVTGDRFSVVDTASGEAVFQGTLAEPIRNEWADETDRLADLSSLTINGTYYIEAEDGTRSPEFSIADDPYRELLQAALRLLYLQRCGCELDEAIAGDFAHPVCHAALATIYGTDEKMDVSGGWHDAGDYGRYVVSGAKAVADLLLAYEWSESAESGNIPERGDLLQEARYELDWMLKMQRSDGGVYHKVTCRSFPGFVQPEEETDELIVCPVSNTATGDFAAVMAMAARVFSSSGEPELEDASAGYLEASRKAWEYLEAHVGAPGFTNPEDVVTGEYPDDDDSDEFLWAAAELARATGEEHFREAAADYLEQGGARMGLGWQEVGAYGVYAILCDEGTLDEVREKAMRLLGDAAERICETASLNPYGIARTDSYEWGSNMGIANDGVLLAMASRMIEDTDHGDGIQSMLDYLLGKNPMGICFVTGQGAVSPEHPHHRSSVAIGKAMPGMLVGGVDSALEDPFAQNVLSGEPLAKRYVDNDQSYSTNEICVYWNSPLILLLLSRG